LQSFVYLQRHLEDCRSTAENITPWFVFETYLYLNEAKGKGSYVFTAGKYRCYSITAQFFYAKF